MKEAASSVRDSHCHAPPDLLCREDTHPALGRDWLNVTGLTSQAVLHVLPFSQRCRMDFFANFPHLFWRTDSQKWDARAKVAHTLPWVVPTNLPSKKYVLFVTTHLHFQCINELTFLDNTQCYNLPECLKQVHGVKQKPGDLGALDTSGHGGVLWGLAKSELQGEQWATAGTCTKILGQTDKTLIYL